MQLNLPILHLLKDARSILIAGAGGGFDIFAGLPLYFTLREQLPNAKLHLANYSFTPLELASVVSKVEKLTADLIATLGHVHYDLDYLPEPYLAQWFHEKRGEAVPVWMLANTGADPLIDSYRLLVDRLQTDAIILVDGGVDSIMRGDEMGAGTLLEDTLSLIAVGALPQVPVKLLACIGFGTEVEERVCHYNALENMAALVKAGGFRGACALTPDMAAFQQYADACRYVWAMPGHHQSHISTRIIPAVEGEFGNHHISEYHRARIEILVSPLMSLYWFFDATTVLQHNTLVDALVNTMTKEEAMKRAMQRMRSQSLRPHRSLPY